MAVQLHGQTTWDAKAKAARAARIAELYEATKLRPDDTVRFRKVGKTSWTEGHPISVNADGSIDVSVTGKVHSILPDRLEVKMTGPRGGSTWEALT